MTTLTERLVDGGDLAAQVLGERFLTLSGRVAPYGEWTNRGVYLERFDRGIFTESLANQSKIPLLLFHDWEMIPIGMSEPAGWSDRADGLWATFRIAHTAVAQSAAQHARDDFLIGMSVGYMPEPGGSTWEYHPQWNPEEGNLDKVTRSKARLAEVSLTPTPAFTGAYVLDVQAEAVDPTARPHLAAMRGSMRAIRRQEALAASRRGH